ncbi:MAG TPA: nucleotide-binding protein [Phycisphaerae bacterium]|nr:nucleotide-binding protein [Phycisphaerae bacterium]
MNGYPQQRTKIFVASSTKSVGVAEALRQVIGSDSLEVVPWKDLGVFVLSEHTVESLEKAANQCHFAVFVLGPDDVMKTEEGGVYIPRDNVVFELGLFLGRIGRKRSYMLRPNGISIKLPTDLSGVTWAQYSPPGTTMDQVREAAEQIRHAMSAAPMMPAISLLSRTVLPPIVLKHALHVFLRYRPGLLGLFRTPAFKADAQVTVCTRHGTIVRHPRVSSLGQPIQPHEGRILWASFPFHDDDRPFEVLLKMKDQTGWVVWSDTGYSRMYSPISGRHNHRICAARSAWTARRVLFLEVHHELAGEIEADYLRDIGHVIGQRIIEAESGAE